MSSQPVGNSDRFKRFNGRRDDMDKLVHSNERNYGIDLLRIVAIFMILMLHLNNHAGIMGSTVKGTINHNISWSYILPFIVEQIAMHLFPVMLG